MIYENSARNFLDHDFVIVHDPQPLPLIEHYDKKIPWIWRCHLDLSSPDDELWKYLRRWIDHYDAVIVSCEEYKHEMKPPQRVFMPAINQFNIKNRELSDEEIDERLARYKIPTDLPLVVQISRFDPWKIRKACHGVVMTIVLWSRSRRSSARNTVPWWLCTNNVARPPGARHLILPFSFPKTSVPALKFYRAERASKRESAENTTQDALPGISFS